MRSSWIDLGKEEHPRLIASSVSPAKKRWVGKFFWKRVQYQMAAYAPQLQVSPFGGSFAETFWGAEGGGGPFQARFQTSFWQLLCVGGVSW